MYAQYGDEHLHARPQGLHHRRGGRSGGRVQGAAQGHHGLRAAPDLPRPREVRRPARPTRRNSTKRSTTRWPSIPDNGDVMSAVVLKAGPEGNRGGARQRRHAADHRRRPQAGAVRPVGQGAAQHQDPPRRRDPRRQDAQGHLGDHPAARGGRRLRRDRPARRCHQGPGRRLRFRQEQVQPRDAGLAPAGLELQALHLFGRAGKRLHARHGGQRRAAVLRCRHHRRPAVGAEELRRQVRRPDVAAPRADEVQEHGVDPHPAVDRHALCAGLDHATSASSARSIRPT